MNFVRHPSNNRVLGAPPGWNHGELPVSALAVTDNITNGHQCVASFWQPDAAELAALNAGGLVMLNVVGPTTPPLMVAVIEPEPRSGT